MKETIIPLGSADSELMEATYFIPQGYHAVIEGDKVIIKKGEGPVSNDLEEAAHFYVDTTIEWFDSEGNPCCYPAFIAGAQWQKQQMMNDTIDGYVTGNDERDIDVWIESERFRWIENKNVTELNIGDKVKLIIIKEE